MSTLVIKNLPEELHARLKEQAQRHHRSVTKEVVNLLEQGLERRREVAPLPPPLRLKSGRMLGIEEIEDAINDGLE
jgi:plasmid stability protein